MIEVIYINLKKMVKYSSIILILLKDKYTREYIKLNEIFRYKSKYIREVNF